MNRSYLGTDILHQTLDLEESRDIRILIAQDHDIPQQKLLFDSKPGPPPESPKIGHSRSSSRTENAPGTGVGSRTSRVPTIPEYQGHSRSGSGVSVGSGVFQRGGRKGSISSIHSVDETFHNKTNKEGNDVPGLAMSCMFEAASSTYKGPSTKVHIIPISSKPYDNAICSQTIPSGELFGFNSLGRSNMVRRPSTLSRSLVPGEIEPDMSFGGSSSGSTQMRRVVLVTRTFSVPWIEEDFNLNMDIQRGNMPPPRNPHAKSQIMDRIDSRLMSSGYRRAGRSLMYAVTIVLSLPIDPDEISPPVSRTGTFGRKTLSKDANARGSVLYGSSTESERRFQFPSENLTDSITTTTSDVDEKVALIGQHWDIFARTLTTLQYVAQKKIYELLKRPMAHSRPQKLSSMALGSDEELMKAATDAYSRIARGIIIDRVRTGHGRWPAWRDETRWLTNWSNTRDQNFFFLTLITAFLGTHTEWLRSLAPKWYRKKYREQHRRVSNPDATPIPTRTVVISKDKMAARRTVFVLAAFLPSNKSIRGGDHSPVRPGTSTSWRAYSQSPPKPTLARQESLRKTINRRNRQGTSLTRLSTKSRTSSITALGEGPDDRTETGSIRYDTEYRARRDSDARSTRSRRYLPEHDPSSQKADITTAAAIAGPLVMRPHFSRQPSNGPPSSASHSRTNSAASASLLQPLQRSNSSGSQWNPPWGSLRNLWGMTSRRQSSDYSDILQSTDEGLGISDSRGLDSPSRLQQMVDDVQNVTTTIQEPQSAVDDHPTMFASPDLRSTSPEPSSPTTYRKVSKPIDVPLKMSVNKEDGVIDVEIPFLDFGSPIFSPGLPPDHSGSSYGDSSYGQQSFMAMHSREPERSPNVGGWLPKVHPDFTLQAVKPYDGVMKDIRLAMSSEPNPPLIDPVILSSNAPSEKWLDICTTLIADTQTWTVSRIHLRRLVRFVRQANSSTILTPAGLPGSRGPSMYGNPYNQPSFSVGASAATMAEFTLEEKFTEELVNEHDGAFAEAIERVLAIDGQTSPGKGSNSTTTTSSSQSSSYRGRTTFKSYRDTGPIILGQLETIAADMAAQIKDSPVPAIYVAKDTLLKEGVKEWLNDIESKNTAAHRAKADADTDASKLVFPVPINTEDRKHNIPFPISLPKPRTQSSDESGVSQETLTADTPTQQESRTPTTALPSQPATVRENSQPEAVTPPLVYSPSAPQQHLYQQDVTT